MASLPIFDYPHHVGQIHHLLVTPAAIAAVTRKLPEALNGVLLFGPTTAIPFGRVEEVWPVALREGRWIR